MILDSIAESFSVVLSGSVNTNQLPFYASYVNLTSTGMTPTKNHGTTNNTTRVTLVPVPGSNEQNQLKSCSIFNSDLSGATVSVQYSGGSTILNIFVASLLPNESIQYNSNSGWRVYDDVGQLKVLGTNFVPHSLRTPPFFVAPNATTNQTVTSGTHLIFHLGKADRAYSTIKIRYNVTTQLGATITFAELAVYKGFPSIGSGTTTNTLTRCGFTDTSAIFNSTGLKTTTVNVTDISIGDDLWVVFATSTSGTNMALRAGLIDDVQVGYVGTTTSRPSLTSSITMTKNYTAAPPWVSWQPSQW